MPRIKRTNVIRFTALLLSLLLHAALFSFFMTPIKTPEKPIVIELVENVPTPKAEPARKRQGSSGTVPRGGEGSRKSAPLNLNLDSTVAIKEHWASGGTAHEKGPADTGHGWSEGVQYGQNMDVKFTNANLGFFHALYRKVDETFDFPEDIARSYIQGKVRVEAKIGRDGRLLNILSSQSSQNILHAYSLALLIHTLSSPLPERAWLKTDSAVIVFEFEYLSRPEGMIARDLNTGIQKNRFAFARDVPIQSKATEKIREVFTHYVPPIVPIPGGVYIDFVLAYEYIHNLANDIPTEAVARQRRLDLLQQQLQQTIHVAKTRGR